MTVRELAEARKKVHEQFCEALKKCEIIKVWLDNNKALCIKYSNGKYYHYEGTIQNLKWY